ncbi:periplasmic heavy metal sensor [Bacteroidetes/Chlorobi group bacterium ChocPot_Mid]|jgi:hypothetical protein|nr:MAG: periplasmic heavy metal sensor [Bacteroidetes/Chlorobi group bacterium ChocPot_Mid]
MKKITLMTLIAIFAIVNVGLAQPMQGRGFGKGNNSMGKIPGYNFYEINQKDLGLSAEQLKKLKTIDDAFQKERIDMQAKIQHAALDMKNEAGKSNISKDALLSKQDNVQKLRNEMQKKALAYKIDLYNVLSDEQKAKINDIKSNCARQCNFGQGFGKQFNGPNKGQGPGKGCWK